jgi:hypothetical protein
MAKKSGGSVEFAQLAFLTVTQPSADVLAFSSAVNVMSSLAPGNAMIIHKVEYYVPPTTLVRANADSDRLVLAITGSNTITDLDIDQPAIYSVTTLMRREITAVGSILMSNYLEKDYCIMPGQGILCPADRMFLALFSAGLGAASTISARVYFSLITLGSNELLQLMQSLRVMT